jgi:hypothetical protein
MPRFWKLLLVPATAILVLATIGLVSIAAATPKATPDITTAQTFTVLAHATNFLPIDVGAKGFGPGDYAVERWVLRRSGSPVGRLNDQFTVNFNQTPSNPTGLYFLAFTFTGKGEITGDGSIVLAPTSEGGFRPIPFDLPVTGGTGSYQNARGQVHVEFLTDADARFTFHLIP